MSAVNPPDSPPKQPVIPEGLATKLGKYGTLALVVLGAFLEISNVSLDKDATLAGAAAVLTLITTIAGRMAQAAAIYRDAPSPFQGVTSVAGAATDWLDGPDGVTVLGESDSAGGVDLPVDDSSPTVPPGLSG
jgi:hypothetical protein